MPFRMELDNQHRWVVTPAKRYDAVLHGSQRCCKGRKRDEMTNDWQDLALKGQLLLPHDFHD
jgi:hypothetical protein